MNKFSIPSTIELYLKPIQINSIQVVYAKPQKFFELKIIAIIAFTQPLSLQMDSLFTTQKTKKLIKVPMAVILQLLKRNYFLVT